MIRKIVLTGGPCAGKTSVINILKVALADVAVFVDEAATLLFSNGYPTPAESWTETDYLALQWAITVRQLQMEAAAEKLACDTGRTLIICDRAPYDNTAYRCGEVVVQQLVAWDREIGYQRYALVFHLESQAAAAPDNYSNASNATRSETLAEAQALELRARKAWVGHPGWMFLSGINSIAELAAIISSRLKE